MNWIQRLLSAIAAQKVVYAGSVMTDVNGNASVIFNTAFPDTDYAISLTPEIGLDTVIAMYGNKATTGFSIKTEDDGGKDEPNVNVDWLAVEYNNP